MGLIYYGPNMYTNYYDVLFTQNTIHELQHFATSFKDIWELQALASIFCLH